MSERPEGSHEGKFHPQTRAERPRGNELDQMPRGRPSVIINHHLRSSTLPDIDVIDMDDIQESFSILKKDLKYRLRGKNGVPGRAGANTAGERDSSSALLLRTDSPASASSHNEERSGIATGMSQVRSRDPSPMPADKGRRDDPQRKEAEVDETQGGQRHSRPGPDVEVAAVSGPSRAGNRARFPLPITSVPHKQEPDSKWAPFPQPLCLIIPLYNADASAVPDHIQKELPNENAEPNVAASAKKSSWNVATSATARLLLRGVRDSADAFSPLRPAAGARDLSFILENCEVWVSLLVHHQSSHRYPSE